jgi:assimilatory nitrate reductase catalytic subunit
MCIEMAEASAQAVVKTTCPYCGVGCGVDVIPDGAGGAEVRGDKSHPANFGKLCVKGSALGETLGLDGRLLHPRINGERASWTDATALVARRLAEIIERHGPGAVGIYLSGQLLTEDYYLANKFAKGFLGVGNVDTNSRLCMASSVAGHRRAFGSDTVPNAYADLDEADLIVLVGSNAAWCHPVLFQRMQAARGRRGALVVNIDPRRTATSEGADLQLSIRPGMDSVLFSWLLAEIMARGAADARFLADHTSGLDEALRAAKAIAPDLATAAARTGLSPADVARFVELFLENERVVTCYSQGVNQSAQGVDKVNAILNCHLATGRIGRAGSGPLSLTGQPNAMGGREVGGLANMLAAHMGYSAEEVDRVRRFWSAPRMATTEGLKAVQLFEAVERGEIKALWVMHTNPAVTLPRADAMRAALKGLDLLVVSEAEADTDTTRAGEAMDGDCVLLPAAAWGEKSGTVTNSERRISRQRAFLKPPGEAKPDWEHIALVAEAMGFEGFSGLTPAAMFREHAALSAFENDGARDFDIGGLATLDEPAYDALEPVQWPVRLPGDAGGARLFGDGRFFTPDRRARLVAIREPALARPVDAAFPLLLNTGRVRDHWHTMTRTARAPRLARHVPEPTIAVNPADAAALGLAEGGYARLDSRDGASVLRVAIDDGLPRGSVFAPFHWTDETAGLARVDAAVHAVTDPVSGQPESKATPVRLTPVAMRTQGFLVSRARLSWPSDLQHVRLTVPNGEAVLFASEAEPDAVLARLAGIHAPQADDTVLDDPAGGVWRRARFRDERLEAVLWVGPAREESALDAAIDALASERLDAAGRRAALAGRTATGGVDQGPLVCSCFGVRRGAIVTAAQAGAADVEALGEALRCGTNCGSCKPELKRIISDVSADAPRTQAA